MARNIQYPKGIFFLGIARRRYFREQANCEGSPKIVIKTHSCNSAGACGKFAEFVVIKKVGFESARFEWNRNTGAQATLRASPEQRWAYRAPSSALVIYGRGSGPVMKLHPLSSLAPSYPRAGIHSRNYYATLSRALTIVLPPWYPGSLMLMFTFCSNFINQFKSGVPDRSVT